MNNNLDYIFGMYIPEKDSVLVATIGFFSSFFLARSCSLPIFSSFAINFSSILPYYKEICFILN